MTQIHIKTVLIILLLSLCLLSNRKVYAQNSDKIAPVHQLEATQVVSGAEPVLYIVSMMHAEDNIPFQELENPFRNAAASLIQLDLLFNQHNAKLDFGPDWTFLLGVARWEPGLLTDHLELGQGLQTHSHETNPNYDLKNVNSLLFDTTSLINIVANGGYTNANTPVGENWVGYIASIKDESEQRVFTTAVGYKDPTTQIPDGNGTIFRPATTGDWTIHDPGGPVIYIGSNSDEVARGGVLDFDRVRPWIDNRLSQLDPSKINTLYWHDSLHNYIDPGEASIRISRWEQELIEYFDPLRESGRIEWKTFDQMTHIYLEFESRLFADDFE